MQARLNEAGVRTVFPKLMSWEDNWPAFGVREGMTDVAVASRSIATADLRDALLRLTEVARPAGVHHAGHGILPPRR